MGLNIYLRWEGMNDEERNQMTGFVTDGKAGYLRSSYNDGGFNNWARRCMNNNGFYDIFNPHDYMDNEDRVWPDWDKCKELATEMLNQARALDNLDVVEIRSRAWAGNENMVLDALEQYRDMASSFGHHEGCVLTNMNGLYCIKTVLPVVAAIWVGKTVHLVVQDDNVHTNYIKTLEQTLEFIDLGKSKNAWIVWSA